ncbi:MAG: TerD family protein [Oscillospiraceae bacterium]|nr:TerD family protein [Oscillospiraceae bacterium]
MSVNLVKGQKVNLQKTDGGTLKKVIVGLGWDEAQPQKSGGLLGSLFGTAKTQNIDCDASAFVCADGKLISNTDIVYFGHLEHSSGAVKHLGDNLTGAGAGDDEQIIVDLQSVPQNYDKIIFVVNIYQARERNQHFGMIQNAFIRIVDADNNQELCRYNLSDNYSGMTAMIFGEIYRHNGQWKFNAVGQATTDNDVKSLAGRFC